ncbi:MAG: tetratricopeptide repeat protein, partial [Caulobacteraceae bacterium]
NPKAIAGLARVYLGGGDIDQARQTLAMASGSNDPAIQSVRAQLALADHAPSGEHADLEAKVAADPNDHQARFDLAEAQSAAGDFQGAVDNLLHIIKADREWNEQAARKQLLVIFEAAGVSSDVAKDGRRRLSSILFS